MPKKMTVKQAAEYFGKHEETIRRWIAEGKLKAEKDPGGRDWWILCRQEVPQEG